MNDILDDDCIFILWFRLNYLFQIKMTKFQNFYEMIIDCQRDIVKESNFVDKYNNNSGKF